jgi:hypothetical protein
MSSTGISDQQLTIDEIVSGSLVLISQRSNSAANGISLVRK